MPARPGIATIDNSTLAVRTKKTESIMRAVKQDEAWASERHKEYFFRRGYIIFRYHMKKEEEARKRLLNE